MGDRADSSLVTAERRLRVLVVEGDPLIAMDLAQTIEDAGAELVGTAATADDALALTAGMEPDIAVIDLSRNGRCDGVAVADAIRKRCSAAALFITGSAGSETIERVRAFNGSTPLFKPLRYGELPIAILRALRQAKARGEAEKQT
jgi:DNA-binding response OmpR family regulator